MESSLDRKTGLGPLVCCKPELLVLGSLPGDRSLALRQYYGHPQNRFWKVMAALNGEACPAGYEEKKALLARCRTALWDVYRAASRPGSMDSDIRRPERQHRRKGLRFLSENPGRRLPRSLRPAQAAPHAQHESGERALDHGEARRSLEGGPAGRKQKVPGGNSFGDFRGA